MDENLFSAAKTAPSCAMPRWKRKALMNGETPREPLSPVCANRVSTSKTPKKTDSKGLPSKTGNKTPGKSAATGSDRFIPNRCLMNNQLSHHLMMKQEKENNVEEEELADQNVTNIQNEEIMRQNINPTDGELGERILAMRIKPPKNDEGEAGMKVLYSKSKATPAKFKSTRNISQTPESILDAPDITDDYYLNLLDWGKNGLIAVPLNSSVYLWNPSTGTVEELFDDSSRPEEDNNPITSVRWIGEGMILGVGLNNGAVELWDAQAKKRIRSMVGHSSRVGALSWNEHILTSGSRSSAIHNHDVRQANHRVASLNHHTLEVCGLEWSPDGKLLASGGNDNFLNIWDVNTLSTGEINTPAHSMSEHTAAVKAVSWCPWQRNIIASGGGSADRCVRVWNAGTGACLQSLDTMAQVSNIAWSGNYKEIVASHGNQMTIWKYPSMVRETELLGHEGRILNMAKSPDGIRVCTTGNDETLRLWKCFEMDAPKQTTSIRQKKDPTTRGMSQGGLIR